MHRKLVITIFIAIFVSVATVVLPWAYTFHNTPLSTDPANWGVFGDYFGGVLSTIIAILGFIAVIVTIRIQNAGITAQLESIKQDRETRDDEVYNKQALQCLEEALIKLSNPENRELYRNRIAWLESARLILTAKELSGRITSGSMRTVYAASEKLIRLKFQTRLDPMSSQETLQSSYFCGPNWDDYFNNRPSYRLEKNSVYTVYKFTSWGREEVDLLDSVVGTINVAEISPVYLGAVQYLNSEEQAPR